MSAPDLPAKISRYLVSERLQGGDRYQLYLGQDPTLRRSVAVCVFDNALRDRVQPEMRNILALQHPNILNAFETGIDRDGEVYLVTEYLKGETLLDLLRRDAPLSVEEKITIVRDVCRALAYARAQGVLHPIFDPANVWRTLDGSALKVAVLPLRLSTDLEENGYQAPEQKVGEPIDQRSDVYAAGLFLFRWLAEQRDDEKMFPELSSTVHRAIAREPSERFASVAEFADRLDSIQMFLQTPTLDDLSPLPASAGIAVEAAAPAPAAASDSTSTDSKSRALDENVQFTVFRPTSLVPATWHTLLVFAHLSEKRSSASEEPDPIEEVRRQAQAILGDSAAHSQQTVDSGEPIPRDGELTIVPRAEDIEFNPPRRSFLWTDENVHREEFRLRAAATLPDGMVRGRVSVFLGSLIIAEIALTLKVNRAAATTQVDIEHEAARPYRKIFASYSRHDAAIVAEYSDYARAMGDRYLQDVVELRSGERWEPRLEEFIRQADVFQLFWSWNAMASTNVSKEWQYALAINRRAFVRPVYWDDPFPKRADLPPPELLALNFERIRPRRQPPRAVSPATSPEASAAAPKPDRAMLSTPAPRRPSASAMPPPVIRESTRYPHSFEPTASAPAPAKRSSRWLAVVGFIAAAIVLLAVLVFFFR